MVQAQNTEPRYSRSLSHPEWRWQHEADRATQRGLVAVSVPQTVPREAETRSEGSFGNPLRLYVGAVQNDCHLTDKQRLGLMAGSKFRGAKSRKRGKFY